jgi:hypothetical protein
MGFDKGWLKGKRAFSFMQDTKRIPCSANILLTNGEKKNVNL